MPRRVILVGASQELVELCDLCGVRIVAVIDGGAGTAFAGHTVFGGDDAAPEIVKRYREVPVVVAPDLPATRKRLANYYARCGFTFASLVSPRAMVSPSARIGTGVVIQSGSNISACVTIGDFCRVNCCANIMHDATIGDYATIAPNAVILGRVSISHGAYIGANATVLPDKTVGRSAVVGAGAVVTRDVLDDATVKGSPARQRKERK